MAAKKKLAVTPARSKTVVGNSPLLVRANEKTRVMAPNAPKNAAMGTVGIPNTV